MAIERSGVLHGVGVGPGDPELLTLRAARVLRDAGILAYFAKAGRRGNARAIVEGMLSPGCEELPLSYPVTTETPVGDPGYDDRIRAFYDEAAARIAERLAAGRDVVVLCEGDPFFYGSFMHLWRRLAGRFPVEVVAGVTGMAGCWTKAGQPITWGDDVLTVLPGTLDRSSLARRLGDTDAAVVMKLGRNLAKVRGALADAGLADRAIYVERGTMRGERIMKLCDKADDEAPYFSLVLVPGQGRRL